MDTTANNSKNRKPNGTLPCFARKPTGTKPDPSSYYRFSKHLCFCQPAFVISTSLILLSMAVAIPGTITRLTSAHHQKDYILVSPPWRKNPPTRFAFKNYSNLVVSLLAAMARAWGEAAGCAVRWSCC
ncbi:MAG: hypothetical protein NTW99_02630 [Chloroflexi bacterium]|nr:hypothetical protein [Chloroflexota bacterium]